MQLIMQYISCHISWRPSCISRIQLTDPSSTNGKVSAGVLVLEELEHARARGAPILAEFLGGSFTCDAHHMTEPQPQGAGVKLCIERWAARLPSRSGPLGPHLLARGGLPSWARPLSLVMCLCGLWSQEEP